jgi:hypothetical protein
MPLWPAVVASHQNPTTGKLPPEIHAYLTHQKERHAEKYDSQGKREHTEPVICGCDKQTHQYVISLGWVHLKMAIVIAENC